MTLMLSGCAEQKSLVLYYSETGTTKTVAQELQKQLGADIEAVEAVEPYSGNFQETMQRAQSDKEPEIKPLKADLKAYKKLSKKVVL